ncbi:MAG: hypothetical protein V7K53_02295 [Nostoc sp.]|uniref:hypothetical protein n=1 Tax=unclassified Nostoc TaxID=2593658 RepID=UPI002AD49C97|nr:hypothetical protein [Nostoc sp. DedQUE04]MDZ8134081.1 hypothetical protein [Nostoc sp. DedQUE04]
MESKTLQSIVIDDHTLQQLKDELKQEMCEIVNNANFSQILSKYGILRQEVLQFEYRIDLNKLQSSDPEEDNEGRNSSLATLDMNISMQDCPNCTCTCWASNLKKWIPCPCN